MHSSGFLGRPGVRGAVLVAAVVLVSASLAFGRAGYYRPPAGTARNSWRFKYGMPNHSLGAPRLPGGPVIPQSRRGGSFLGEAGTGGGGGSRSGMVSQGGSAFSSTWNATQSAPYESDTRFHPAYYHNYNSYWLHGYWGGGLWGWGRWCVELGIWGLPRWSMGPVYYPSGYGLYQNPFLEGATGLTAADRIYSLPIQVQPDEIGESEASTSRAPTGTRNEATLQKARQDLLRSPQEMAALKKFDLSRDAFRKGDYDEALQQVDAALAILSNDPALHQYRALILFARAEYRRAAIAMYAVIAVSPGFDWTTLSGFYLEQATYTAHLRKLEAYYKANPEAADAAFLLSCHYLTCRHFESALKQMLSVGECLPDDALISELTVFLENAVAFESPPTAAGPDEAPSEEESKPEEGPPASDAAEIAGHWKAERNKDVRIELTLTAEGQFQWTAFNYGAQHDYSGKYAAEGDRIILAGRHGTVLGQWKSESPTRFNFKLLENDPSDAGLDFVRSN